MHRTVLWNSLRAVTALAIALLSVGCADFGAVRTYADETKRLSATFAAMPETTVKLCEERFVLEEQTRDASAAFKVDDVYTRATTQCAPLAEQSAQIQSLVTLLDDYADTLAALADEKLPKHSKEFKKLETAVTGLAQDSGEPVVPKNHAKAVITLGKLLARLATERVARGEIKQLLEQDEAVNAVTGALQWYAIAITRSQVDTYHERARITMAGLTRFEKAEPLGMRALAVALRGDLERINHIAAANNGLIAAMVKHQGVTATMREKYDKPDDPALREQLSALAEALDEARRHLQPEF